MAIFALRDRSSVSAWVNVRRYKKVITSAAWTRRLAWLGAKCSVSTIRVSLRCRYPVVPTSR